MKKTDTYMKVIVGILCTVVALYIVFSVLRSAGSNYTTYKAVRYEVGDGISTSGFVVREETVLTSEKSIVVLTRAEGERVSAGGVVAKSYLDEAARHQQARIDAMEEELAQMEYAYSYTGGDNGGVTLDNEIIQDMQTLNLYVARQDFTAAEMNAELLKSHVLRRYITSADAETLHQRIQRTRAELDAVRAQAKTASQDITVEQAGFFSGTADGFETELTPEFVDVATVAQVEALGKRQSRPPVNAIGRLITSPRWYYITVAETEGLQGCKVGSYVTVQFSYEFYNSLQMRVSRIGKSEDGKSVLVLTTDRFMQTAAGCRTQTAEIVFSTKTGLRVPKSAIHVDENGVSGVFVLSGVRAVWKPIEILFDSGDFFIVREDRKSTDNLWPDDEIILTSAEITDGMVMEQ